MVVYIIAMAYIIYLILNALLGSFITQSRFIARGHITMGSFTGRGNQYIQYMVKVLYCKLPTIVKKLPFSPHRVGV